MYKTKRFKPFLNKIFGEDVSGLILTQKPDITKI